MCKVRRSSLLKFQVSLIAIVVAVMAVEIRDQVGGAALQLGKSHTLLEANTSSASTPASASSVSKSSTGYAVPTPSSIPPDAQGAISAALGKGDSSYWVHPRRTGFRGENLRHALVAEFTRQGAELCSEVRGHNLRWRFETRAYGYGNARRPAKAVAPRAKANRVEYRRDGMTEWYENGPLGLEQGFTLAHTPSKANGQALTLELALQPIGPRAGALVTPVLEPEGKGVVLRGEDGETSLRYTGLEARDATGRELRTWLEVRGERLLVRVDDGGARYPVVVDPWVQQAEVTSSDAAEGDQFGLSVAVSGTTAVVGAWNHTVGSNQGQGAAYVFVESGGTWTQRAELTASDGAEGDQFGISVAVDGSTAVVGALWKDDGEGAAYVFVESGGTWSQQAELTPSDGAYGDGGQFGTSVAVSANTAIVGALGHTVGSNQGQGAAYVFAENGGTWSQEAELTASDGAANDQFGLSVAVSGTTAIVGAPYHPYLYPYAYAGPGAAYVFVESGGTWSQQAELTPSDGRRNDWFGTVAVSGSTAVVGALNHKVGSNREQGAAYVFVQSGGMWSQQAELTASDGAANDWFGLSVAVSGSTAVVGAPRRTVGSNHDQGVAYVFVESGGTWSRRTELIASNAKAGGWFGNGVAVAGRNAIVGAPRLTGFGSVYVFEPGPGQPEVTRSPAALSFGDQALEETSKPKTVMVTNTGSATLDISSITVGGDFAINANTCGSALDVGASCSVSVTFTPKVLGAQTVTLTLTDNAPDSPQMVPISGTSIPQATLNPVRATYAKQQVGTTSLPKTFILKNNQLVPLTGIAISTTGDFAVSSTTCGTSLLEKQNCTISVFFTPTQTGTRTGQLSVSNSAGNSPQTSKLSGTGM